MEALRGRDWPFLGAAIGGIHLCGLLSLVSEKGPQAQKGEEAPGGRKPESWLSAPPTGLARRSADSLPAPESH